MNENDEKSAYEDGEHGDYYLTEMYRGSMAETFKEVGEAADNLGKAIEAAVMETMTKIREAWINKNEPKD